MKREPSQLRGRIVQSSIVLAVIIMAVVFGFVVDKPTSTVGLSMIIICLVFLLWTGIVFFYKRSQKKKSQRF